MAIIGLLCFVAAVSAIPWAGPEPTLLQKLNPRGISPKPTAAPFPKAAIQLLNRELYPFHFGYDKLDKRQSSSSGANLCGYIGGYGDLPITCDVPQSCIVDDNNLAVGCCTDINFCTLASTCIDYATASGCTTCSVGTGTLFCTDDFNPYCFTNFLAFDAFTTYTGYGCNQFTDFTPNLSYSSTAATPAPSFVSSVAAELSAFSSSFSASSSSLPASTPGSSSGPAFSLPPVTVTVTAPSRPPASPIHQGPDNSNNGGSSTPVGAIAGGTVGGVVVLAIIGFLIWFFGFRKKKQQNQPPQPPQPQPETAQQQPPYNPYPPGQGGGAPAYNYAYPPPVQSPPPQQYLTPQQSTTPAPYQGMMTPYGSSPTPASAHPSYMTADSKFGSSGVSENPSSPNTATPLVGSTPQPGYAQPNTSTLAEHHELEAP